MLAGLYLYGIGARRQLFQSHFVELFSGCLTAFVFSQHNSAGHIGNGDYYRCVFGYHVAHEELFMRRYGPQFDAKCLARLPTSTAGCAECFGIRPVALCGAAGYRYLKFISRLRIQTRHCQYSDGGGSGGDPGSSSNRAVSPEICRSRHCAIERSCCRRYAGDEKHSGGGRGTNDNYSCGEVLCTRPGAGSCATLHGYRIFIRCG